MIRTFNFDNVFNTGQGEAVVSMIMGKFHQWPRINVGGQFSWEAEEHRKT